MTLPTPPGTSHRGKECMYTPTKPRVVWSKTNKTHSIVSSTPPRLSVTASASKGTPKKSILKRPTTPILPLLFDEPRESTPEPQDPASDSRYLASPVSTIVQPDSTLRELIEAYSVLTARLRSALLEGEGEGAKQADCSWPLFLPLRRNKSAFLVAVERDLGRALQDPFANGVVADETEEECVEEKSGLPSPVQSPKKKRGMSAERVKYARDLCTTTHSVLKFLALIFTMPSIYQLFSDKELKGMMIGVLAIPLATVIPTPNARKTCALAIWLIQTQRLPAEVLSRLRDRIGYALRRAIEGELGKEGKKGSVSDGLKAIHDLAMYEPSIFVPVFSVFIDSILAGLLAPTSPIRMQACHALGGLAYASTRIPVTSQHTYMSDAVYELLRPSPQPDANKTPTPPGSPSKDPPIIRTLRTTLGSDDPRVVAHGPVWALSVIAHFIILLGPALRMNKSLQGIISALLSVAIRHPRSSVKSLVCVVWRTIVWSFFRPAPVSMGADGDLEAGMMAKDYDGTDDELDLCGLLDALSPREKKVRESYWNAVKAIVEWGSGVATIGSLLHLRSDEEEDMKKVMNVLKALAKKSGYSAHDAIDLMRFLLSGFHKQKESDPEGWQWSKLLPEGLFSANPGLLTADFETLEETVRPIVEGFELAPEHVRPLTATELSFGGVWEDMVEVWLEMIEQVRLEEQIRLNSDLREVWRGLLKSRVRIATDEGNDSELAQLAERVAAILIQLLSDDRFEYKVAPNAHNATLSGRLRSVAASRLSVVRDLFVVAAHIIPQSELPITTRALVAHLIAHESELVWEDNHPNDARTQWTRFCVELLSCCEAEVFDEFWSVRTASRKGCGVAWEWDSGTRALVWRKFVNRWMQVSLDYESALCLLGVPLNDVCAWEMSVKDVEQWEAGLKHCIDLALDREEKEPYILLDRLAWIIGSIHVPTTPTSTRIADILLTNFEINESTTELPMKLFELVSDTLSSTYPPEPRNKTVSFWLIRTVTRIADKCPPALLGDVLNALQEGVAMWVADDYRALSLDEYAMDVLPMYQTMVAGLQLSPPSVDTLESLTQLLESPCLGRNDKPEGLVQCFQDLWIAKYADTAPPESWKGDFLACIQPPTVDIAEDLEDVFNVHATPRKITFALLPTTPKSSISRASSPPCRPSRSFTASSSASVLFSPTSPLAFATGRCVTPPTTPPRHRSSTVSPRKENKSKNKENISPSGRPVPVTPVAAGRVAVMPKSPGGSALGKRPRNSLDADESPSKRVRDSAFSRPPLTPSGPVRQAVIDPDDSDEECNAVENTLLAPASPNTPRFQAEPKSIPAPRFYDTTPTAKRIHNHPPTSSSPTPTASKKRTRTVMEAIELPSLMQIRSSFRGRTTSLNTAQMTIGSHGLRRVKSFGVPAETTAEPLMLSASTGFVQHKRMKTDESFTLPSSPLRALENAEAAGSDDSMMNVAIRPTLSNTRTSLDDLSSDDDPHYGQVTPHHLVSPAMRRQNHLKFDFITSDPPSDDSNASLESPTRDHVAKRRERLMAMSSSSPPAVVEDARRRVGLPPSRLTKMLMSSSDAADQDA